MPDTQAADWIAVVGTLIGSAAAAWGLKRGERDKKTVPAPTPELAGISATLVSRSVLDELTEAIRALTAELQHQRQDEETRRQLRTEMQLARRADDALNERHGRSR